MHRARALYLVWLVGIVGCVHVSKTVLINRSHRPVPPSQVGIFLETDTVPDYCERVAIMHGSGSQEYTNEASMWNKFREEAGKLGANAVKLLRMEDAGTGERVVGALFGTRVDRDADALALWCSEEAPVQRLGESTAPVAIRDWRNPTDNLTWKVSLVEYPERRLYFQRGETVVWTTYRQDTPLSALSEAEILEFFQQASERR